MYFSIVICNCVSVFEFFMTYQSLCSLSALKGPAPSLPLTANGEWETSYFRGSWVEGTSAGGSRNFLSHWQNPCFPFTLCDESVITSGVNVRVILQQKRPDTDLHPIGFHIYKVSHVLEYQCCFELSFCIIPQLSAQYLVRCFTCSVVDNLFFIFY